MSFVDDLRAQVDELLEKWSKIFPRFEQLGVPLKEPISQIERDIRSLNRGLVTRLEFVHSVKDLPTSSDDVLPESQTSAVLSGLEQLDQAMDGLSTKLDQLEAAGGAKALNHSNLQITAHNHTTLTLGEISSLWSVSAKVLSAFLSLLPALGIGSTATMANRASRLLQLKSQASEVLETSRNILSDLKTSKETSESILKALKESAEGASEDRNAVTELRSDADAALVKIREKVTVAREVGNQAAELRTEVRSFKAEFEDFDTQLQKRLATLEKANQKTAEAEEKNSAREAEIERLLEKSDTMLKGATVAGLASSFSSLSKNYNRETKGAERAFYISIALLVMSVIPLIIYFLPNISLPVEVNLPFLAEDAINEGGVSISGTVSRLIILLPATWLAAFSSKRYRRLFRLKVLYDQRAALAQSLEGFKQEAPKFKQEVAAAVFWDLTQRSQITQDLPDSSDIPNPILRWLLGRLEGGADDIENVSGQSSERD